MELYNAAGDDRNASFEFVTHSVVLLILLPGNGNAANVCIEFYCLVHQVCEVYAFECTRCGTVRIPANEVDFAY